MKSKLDVDVRTALELLGKRRLVLVVHDASFPSAPGEDTGRGSPYTRGGREFLCFARSLGFDGVQLGPQGQTSRANSSPYDATLFSRNQLSVDLFDLAESPEWAGVVTEAEVRRVVGDNPAPGERHVQSTYVHDAYSTVLRRAFDRLSARRAEGDASVERLVAELQAFRSTNRGWLEPDSLYALLEAQNGDRSWRYWDHGGSRRYDRVLFNPPLNAEKACQRRRDALMREHEDELASYALTQLVVHRQHQGLRQLLRELELRLYGDVQVGMSPCDVWRRHALLLDGYLMGAPPSRTNVEGQAWGFQVFDPDQYRTASGAPGPVLAFIRERYAKLLSEFDGLRIDHPHGLVCPWVYRADAPDPLLAVQSGARLFSSPDLPDHRELARYAVVTRDQLSNDPEMPRHADDWVSSLTKEQVATYARQVDAIVDQVVSHGRDTGDLVCEVLSTQPYPLRRVLERHGLGRFRITQKANLDDPDDVYRSENAEPVDWIMVGTHDTPSIWRLVRQWQGSAEAERQAAYLARRLAPGVVARDLVGDPSKMAHAKVADIFASPAENVMIFFADLLGLEGTYNQPGTVSDGNWTLRVRQDYATHYASEARRGRVLSLPRVLALALRARGLDSQHPSLLERLERRAGWWPLAK